MTAPQREILVNNAATTLNGGINDSVTSITVTDGSVFPSTGNFRIIIDSELMLVTARSTNTLTVTRGIESTTAASHSNNVAVSAILTAGGFDQWARDSIPTWGISPPYGKIVADNGSTILTSSDFTWVNQESSTVSDQDGTILLTAATTANLDNRILTRTAPSTPYSYIAAFHTCMPRGGSDDGCFVTMGLRESSTGKFELIQFGTNANNAFGIVVADWTNATTSSATLRDLDWVTLIGSAVWLRVEDNGTNLFYSVSGDGVNWIEIHSVGRTAFMAGGPDQVFWGARNDANTVNVAHARLLHWSRES